MIAACRLMFRYPQSLWSARRNALTALLLCLLLTGCMRIMDTVASGDLSSPPDGPETPARFGSPFERVAIPSGPSRLVGSLVTAPTDCRSPAAVLIFHGSGETVSEWAKAQAFLYEHCVSSLVFDYRGNGDSGGRASFTAMGEDAQAAYRFAIDRLGRTGRFYLLGHSMGNGVMLPLAASLAQQPDGVIVASAFASLNAFIARQGFFWRICAFVMPEIWNNVAAAGRVKAPLLVINSAADKVILVSDGQAIFDAANQPKSLVVLQGFPHNAIYRTPSEDWWHPVLAFMASVPGG